MVENFPLTNAQRNIWNIQKVNPGLAVSNLGGVGLFHFDYNFKFMSKVLNQIIFENDNFWLRFSDLDGEPYQYFIEHNQFDNFEELDFTGYSNEYINAYFTEQSKKIQQLENSKLYNFCIFKHGNGKMGVFAVVNHLIFDAWSFPLIVDQIIDKYTKLLKGETIISTECQSYRVYLESLDLKKIEDKNEKGRAYFKQLYSEDFVLSELSNIPINRDDIIGDRVFFNLTDSESQTVTEFCNNSKLSLAVLFESALFIYLSKISRQNSPITIGLPTLNRKGKERQILGMFIGMLPMTIDIQQAQDTLQDLFKAVQDQHKILFKYQSYSLSDIMGFLSASQGFDSGMFDVMFNYQNGKSESASKYHVKTRYYSNGTSEVPLVMMVNERDGETIEISYDYQINNLSLEEIEAFHARILHIVKQIIDNSQQKIKDITIVPDNELEKINTFSKGISEDIGTQYVSQLFEEVTKLHPNKVASKDSTGTLTYKELDDKSNQFARYLLEHGLQKGDRICVNLNNDLTLMIVFWGILKSGGVYVPVDIEYPLERTKYIISNSQSKFYIANNINSEIREGSDNVILIDIKDLLGELVLYSTESLNIRFRADDSAYILYTSGTTGNPKGVENTHAGILNRILWMKEQLKFTANDRILQKTSISFDVSVWELILPHVIGAVQILCDLGTAKDTDYLKKLIITEEVTCAHFVPSLLNVFLEDSVRTNLKKIVCSGEQLQYETVKAALIENPGVQIYNLYGPTEAAIDVTCYTLDENSLSSSIIPIGKPVYNTEIRIVNKEMKDLPIGVAGELVIYGIQVAKGYFGNEHLTQAVFGIDPARDGMRYYKTGDIAYWNRLGQLIFIGREDGQIKINGTRIEIGEIESQLLKLEGISDVSVVSKVVNDKELLVAFYTGEKELSNIELRTSLLNTLPRKWVPSIFKKIEQMPLSNSGKTDIKKLKSYSIKLPISKNSKPKSKLESDVLELVRKILGVENLDVKSDLFANGLDSIKSIRVISELSKLGYHTDIEKLYQYVTVDELVEKGLTKIHQETRTKEFELLKKEDMDMLFNKNRSEE